MIGTAGIACRYIPGEHDVVEDDGKSFSSASPPAATSGAFSFDAVGVHFIALDDVIDVKPGELGTLGAAQLRFLEQDLAAAAPASRSSSSAACRFYVLYEAWGSGTEDGAQALALLAASARSPC